MLEAMAQRLTQPIFLIQAANDYSIRPTLELAASVDRPGPRRLVEGLSGLRHQRHGGPSPREPRRDDLGRRRPPLPGAVPVTAPGAWIEDLAWPEVGGAHRGAAQPCVMPIGARSKEHGHHLPMKTDYLLARALCDGIASALPVLVAPVVDFGYYPAFTGLSRQPAPARRDLHRAARATCIDGLIRQGARSIAVVNTGVSTEGAGADRGPQHACKARRAHCRRRHPRAWQSASRSADAAAVRRACATSTRPR